MNDILVAELMRLVQQIKAEGRPYNHDHWFTFDSYEEDPTKVRKAACLGGYAAEHEPFKKLGLRAHFVVGTRQHTPRSFDKYPLHGEPQLGPMLVGMGAMQQFFGFTESQVDYLFGSKVEDVLNAGGGIFGDTEVAFTIDDIIERLQEVIDGDIP